LVQDRLWFKTDFGSRQTLVQDRLWFKTDFDSRQTLVQDRLWFKTDFGSRQTLVQEKEEEGFQCVVQKQKHSPLPQDAKMRNMNSHTESP